jgi:hypothetical protein
MMTRVSAIVMVVVLALCQVASAGGFYASTNLMGYQGNIWNVTDGTGPWATATPRNGSLYVMSSVPGSDNYNELLSSWWLHPTSNQNNSFLQLAEEVSTPSITSQAGGWDSTLKVFTVTVSGADAPYPWSRMWQPDNGVAWGVTFSDYTYSFTATFASEAVLDGGWLVNAVEPESITGSFSGHFVVTADVNKNPITNGDTYGFDIAFNSAWFSSTGGSYTADDLKSYFGAVPEPMTLGFLALGGLMLRRRSA